MKTEVNFALVCQVPVLPEGVINYYTVHLPGILCCNHKLICMSDFRWLFHGGSGLPGLCAPAASAPFHGAMQPHNADLQQRTCAREGGAPSLGPAWRHSESSPCRQAHSMAPLGERPHAAPC